MRASGRILPGGKTHAEGSVRIELDLLRNPRNTGFGQL
jgi:hypothetical protein